MCISLIMLIFHMSWWFLSRRLIVPIWRDFSCCDIFVRISCSYIDGCPPFTRQVAFICLPKQISDIAELLELGQPIAIEVSENDTATLQELASLGFIDASTATDGGECGTLLNQQPQSERLPLLSGSSEPHIVKIPTALLSVDIDAAVRCFCSLQLLFRIGSTSLV